MIGSRNAEGYTMTLREALKRYKGRIVRIGAACAYFYIGPADDKTEATIEAINDRYIESQKVAIKECYSAIPGSEKRVRKKIADAKEVLAGSTKIRNCKGQIVKLTQKSRKHYEELASLNEEQIQELIEEEKQRLRDRARDLEEYIQVMPRIMDRNLADNFEADPIYDGLSRVLIVEGIESGRYWLRSEYESGKTEDED